jgi:mannose-6-phosphate isomerase
VTAAANPASHTRRGEGLSVVVAGGKEVRLADVLRSNPVAVVGESVYRRCGATTALLVKLLDPAERLPIHAHPTRGFAARVLGSQFGKAEAWIVLGTRVDPGLEDPSVYLGFHTDLTHQVLRHLVLSQDTTALLAAMNRVAVSTGDVYFVRPGLPHAIGPGVLIAEVQEPTDYSIVLEWHGFPISPEEAHLGRGWDTMLEAIDRDGIGPEALGRLRGQRPSGDQRAPVSLAPVLPAEARAFFDAFALEVTGDGPWPLAKRFAIGVVTDGSGAITNRCGSLSLRPGETFVLLAGAPATRLSGDLQGLVFAPQV